MKQNVISREYKVMLKKERFVGSQDHLFEVAGDFWHAFKNAIQDIVPDTNGSLDTVTKQRTIRFYDSAERLLRNSNYVFRERVDTTTGKREVTLKFRHPDRLSLRIEIWMPLMLRMERRNSKKISSFLS